MKKCSFNLKYTKGHHPGTSVESLPYDGLLLKQRGKYDILV